MLITGARPNFIKAAPLFAELRNRETIFESLLVHTGQHYDHNLSQVFFDELKMPQPDIILDVGSGSHSRQTANIMVGLEDAFEKHKPDMVLVFGDVNSTLAGSLVAAKMRIPIAHVESGLRSFDMSMPEEVNRIVTDRLSDICFVSESSGMVNLKNEGMAPEKLFLVGNIMIDSLKHHLDTARNCKILEQLGLTPKSYAVLTLHRPSNVDDKVTLEKTVHMLNEISLKIPVVFPCHPRTKKELTSSLLWNLVGRENIRIVEPLGYIEFLRVQSDAKFILTDSGGVQEESTYLGVPCITLRYNTERPVTVEIGTNILTGPDPSQVMPAIEQILSGKFKKGNIPPLWDGQTARRITEILISGLSI